MKTDDTPAAACTLDEIKACIPVLESLVADGDLLAELDEADRIALMAAAGQLSRPDRKEIKKRRKAMNRKNMRPVKDEDRAARALTGIRSARTATVFEAPQQLIDLDSKTAEQIGKLNSPRNCYVCKKEFVDLHFFYDTMCPACGEFNYQKRFQTASLENRVALITGARVKIGFQATLMMLRAGATVIATTRFPKDAAIRYSGEKDFAQWGHRLQIFGLDLRHTPSVEIFATHIETHYQRLDILINNAAQTVRRPPGFYAHLMETENLSTEHLSRQAASLLTCHEECKAQLIDQCGIPASAESALPVAWHGQGPGVGLRASAELSQIPYSYDNSLDVERVFPTGELDADLQQKDYRKTNSWRLKIGEIQTPELLEVQLVNAIAPFVLCNRLIPLMKRDFTGEKHIVNVTAMEGKFFRFKQASRHPHTNMAKAALNMMTHTAAGDLAKYGIYMNAVDTGWVTDEDPAELAKAKEQIHDFQPPLDIVDGAARICDPFFDGILTKKHWCGKFLKDYRPIDW
ncbi:oxidoreductase (3-oxoacyl-[acyl-carrier-protein] reductase) [Desulforapulum autotrophicum HRM2]|uniref:Oxidoreductase (3-oxoacyl-[acyl-carrier-protein] reductase) n=1 Tax=Desulforapulum autotrophicum (strain ATCC 43914 / DSM 3382 / VKM B-1955 / HRM2) TaxID=177437 RepID=C0QBU0_DESAH|nr:SDR family oxidoreductase [Desulforapulum autotrophicum]ACN14952.1 oxidoreductase (3-oxoacyl-[acyl-carrier-protein] reductase) [Desulforapulum autotrophicum HRM2]